MNSAGHGFGQGVVAGVVVAAGGLTGALLITSGVVSDAAIAWVGRNLGTSALAFGLVLAAWLRTLAQLRSALAEAAPPERVVHLDGLAEVWVGLFFGVGVIWTAIGMRAALLQAVGGDAAGASGAAMLARLVDGGILLSLSTTIVGGIGGYFMRVVRTLWLGPALRRFYQEESARELVAVHTTLLAIERQLEYLAEARECKPK